MASEKVTFSKGESATLPEDHVAGRLLVETDTGNAFLDTTDSTRIQITDSRKLNSDGSIAMDGNLDVGNHKIINLASPSDDQDAVTKQYVDTEFQTLESEIAATASNYLPLKGGTLTGVLDMSGNYIQNLATPQSDQEAANKSYVDSSISQAVGGITSFRVDSNEGSGYESLEALKLAHPTGEIGVFYLVQNKSSSAPNVFDEYFWTGSAYERAGSFGDVDTSNLATKSELNNYLLKSGASPMEGNLDMSNNKITNVGTPSSDFDAANKSYVDSIISSGMGNSTYVFTASFDGTTLTAKSAGGTPEHITWKFGDTVSITLENKSSDTPFYYGDFTFRYDNQDIVISTTSVSNSSGLKYLQKSILNAIYVVVESQSALLVTSTESPLVINDSNSGLDIVQGDDKEFTTIIHKKLEQSERYGPDIQGAPINLNYNGTFIVPAIGYDTNGHVVYGGQQEYILPRMIPSSDTNVTQTNSNTNADFRVLLSNSANDTTETAGVYKSGDLLFNPSTGVLVAPKFTGIIDDGVIT